MQINKTLIRNNIISLLTNFASEDFQRTEWVKRYRTTVIFPNELFEQWSTYFYNHGGLIEDGIISKKEWYILSAFHKIIREFIKDYHYKKLENKVGIGLVNYKPWVRVRIKAKETLEKLGWDKEKVD